MCFGVDPTSEQINAGEQFIFDCFLQCGFEDVRVEIGGQTHLIGLFSEFPSIVLKIFGKTEYQFQTVSDWAANADMDTVIILGDAQSNWISNIRELIRTTNACRKS